MTSHASRRPAHPGRSSSFYRFMSANTYDKRPFSLSEQVDKLESKGLLFDDKKEAEQFLFDVSYYRLRAYTYPFQDNSDDGEHLFVRDDIHFSEITDLYKFDRDLRSLLFNAIARIEVSIRARMTQIYSEQTGDSHWFLNKELYRCDFDRLIEDIGADVNRSNEEFIKHYYNKYDEPELPPCWMSLEVVSFGTLSRLYQSLKKDDNKKRLAQSYGIADINVFENWFHAISNLRNCCAHHGRIWNRRFMVNMVLPYNTSRLFMDRESLNTVKRNKLFPLLSAIKYLLDSIDESNNFKDILLSMLNRNIRLLSLRDMGFPSNWKQLSIWR